MSYSFLDLKASSSSDIRNGSWETLRLFFLSVFINAAFSGLWFPQTFNYSFILLFSSQS